MTYITAAQHLHKEGLSDVLVDPSAELERMVQLANALASRFDLPPKPTDDGPAFHPLIWFAVEAAHP